MPTSSIWLTYDLGVDGDYESLYHWLDTHDAVECGDSVAYFRYDHKRDLVEDLRKELGRVMKLRLKDRVYVVFPSKGGKYKGRFILGRRKPAPWVGVAGKAEETIDEPS